MNRNRRLLRLLMHFIDSGGRYLLYDDFSVDRADGRIDQTLTDPDGEATRSTGATGSISGGAYVLSGAADDSLWYDEAVTRKPGRCVVFTPTITDATTTIEFGFDTDQAGALAANAIRMASDLLKPYDGGTAGPQIYVPADATEYSLAVCLLAAGAAYFLDGNLLYKGGTNATDTLYAGIANTDANGTIDSVQVSNSLYALTPLATDAGTSDAVESVYYTDDGKEWTGDTWTNGVSGSSNTPTLGAEVVVNGGFDSGSNWSLGTGWSIGAGVATHASGSASGLLQSPGANLSTSLFYNISVNVNRLTAGSFYIGTGLSTNVLISTAGVHLVVLKSVDTNVHLWANADFDGDVDDYSFKPLPWTTVFRSISDAGTPYVYASSKWISTFSTQAGLVICLDDADDPQNFLIVWHDGSNNVHFAKVVADVLTTLATVAATYSADAPLVVRTREVATGIEVWVIYNGVYIGNYTVTDAGIISNTLHGLFSTHADNDCSDVTIYATSGHTIPGA